MNLNIYLSYPDDSELEVDINTRIDVEMVSDRDKSVDLRFETRDSTGYLCFTYDEWDFLVSEVQERRGGRQPASSPTG